MDCFWHDKDEFPQLMTELAFGAGGHVIGYTSTSLHYRIGKGKEVYDVRVSRFE